MPSHPTSLRPILALSSPLYTHVPKWAIQVYPPKLPHTALFSYGATYCAHLILFGVYVLNYTNNEPHYYAALSSLLLLVPPHSKYSHCTLFSNTVSLFRPPSI